MEPMIFVLLVVTIIGADEPIFTFKPSIAFDTLERCEERLISDLSQGDRVSTYEYFSQNRRMISSQTQFKKTFATCVETGVPSPLLDVIGNNGSPMPLDHSALKKRPRSRPQIDLVTTALNGASMVGDEAPAGAEAATKPLAEQFIRGMQLAIAECWILGALSAASPTVVVEMELTLDGKPVPNSIKMLGFEGGDEILVEPAFESAKRAIQRCGAQGFELPKDQFATWRRVELTFSTKNMN